MKRDGLQAWLAGAMASLFYLSFHSVLYNFDGVACAIAVDLGNPRYLAHGNHVLYGLLGLAFRRLWGLFGYRGASLLCLQALDGLLGGATVGLVWRLLEGLKTKASSRITACAGLALSQAFWVWSLEAQVYILAAFLLALAAQEAMSPSPRPERLGFWHAMACLGHVGAVMFWPTAAYAVFRGRDARRRLLACAGSWLATLAAAYVGAAVFCVRPHSLAEARVWLLGSAALKVDHSFTWYGGWSLPDLRDWLLMCARIFSDGQPLAGAAAAAAWLLGAAGLSLACLGAYLARRERCARLALLWLGGYALLFVSWQPYYFGYRVTDLPALWILSALALERGGRALRAAAAASAAGLGAFNLSKTILPACDSARNAAYQDALWVGQATPEQAWIVASGAFQVYIPYFAQRRPLNVRYFEGKPEAFAARLNTLNAAGQEVFVTSPVLVSEQWESFLRDYGLVEAGRRGETVLYRVTKGKPSGRSTKKLKMAAAERKGPNGMGSERLSLPRSMRPTP